MRTAKDPDFKMDWGPMDGVNRREKQREAVSDVLPVRIFKNEILNTCEKKC